MHVNVADLLNLFSGVIQMDIVAKLYMLTVVLQTGRKELAFCALKEISAKVIQDSEKMDVNAQVCCLILSVVHFHELTNQT